MTNFARQNHFIMNKFFFTVAIMLMAVCAKAQTLSENGPTMDWSSWNTYGFKVSFSVELQPGDNIVRLYNSSNWMPNIDCMRLQYDSPLSIKSHTARAKNGKAYNLQGVEVKNTGSQRGIYIVDGQKRLSI